MGVGGPWGRRRAKTFHIGAGEPDMELTPSSSWSWLCHLQTPFILNENHSAYFLGFSENSHGSKRGKWVEVAVPGAEAML